MKATKIKAIRLSLYKKFIEPKSIDPDDRRREYILNIIFSCLSVIAIANLTASLIHHQIGTVRPDTNSLGLTSFYMFLVLGLFWLSRRGFYKIAAVSIVSLLGFIGTFLIFYWSFELPVAELTFVLTIVMSGILFRARASLMVSALVSILVVSIGLAQVYGYLHPDVSWFNQPLKVIDIVGYVAVFIIIGWLTWLANKEIDSSLARARASEAALEVERDNLEVKVIERTRELEQAQLIRVMELQRFAEFGRMSAGLLHDLANPLTVASLNLEELKNQHRSARVHRALQSLHHISRYVEAARKQLHSHSNLVNFSIQKETKQIIKMLKHRIRENGLKIEIVSGDSYRLYGDPVKFSQMMANLLINAIEAYDDLPADQPKRPIKVIVTQQNEFIKVVVHDWGHGLNLDESGRIFEAFYSTKLQEKRNMGIGLSMVKKIVSDDFNGSVKVTSSKRLGTKFTVLLTSQSRDKK